MPLSTSSLTAPGGHRSSSLSVRIKPSTASMGHDEEMRRAYNLRKYSHSEGPRDYHFKPCPYFIRWVHGFNPKVGVINLCDKANTEIFYAASNFGILYNWTTRQMKILQGHRHMLTNIATDVKGKWLVTADTGSENMVIIWDHEDCYPQRTIFSPHRNNRLAKLALSGDAKYLVTIAYGREAAEVFWWIWSFGNCEPHATKNIPVSKDSVIDIQFHPENSLQFVLMTKHELWILVAEKIWVMERGALVETDDYQLKSRCPEKIPNPDHGRMTCFTYVNTTCQVLVCTSRGYILVYGYTMEYKINPDSSNYENFRFIKAFKAEQHRINVIKYVDGLVVIGNALGEIRFYDDHVKLLYWVHGFKLDSVRCLSFNISPRSYIILDPLCGKSGPCWEKVVAENDSITGEVRTKLLKKKIPEDCTKAGLPFLVRDFIVCSPKQGIGFVDFVPEKNITILDYKSSPALALTVHPEKTLFCVGYLNGNAELVDYGDQHKIKERLDLRDYFKVVVPPKEDSIRGTATVTIPHLSVTCLKYSPSGMHLACGLNTGQLIFLDPFTLDVKTKKPYKDTSFAIKEINFSPDSMSMVCADIGKTVLVYKFSREDGKWRFVGKHRSHYKNISTAFFLEEKNDAGEYRLLSIGMDRIMVEYDVANTTDERLEIISLERIDQTAVPLSAIVWPVPEDVDPDECHTRMPLVLLCNNEYKYKILSYDTAMTLATFLGPRFEHPVEQMLLITHKDEEKKTEHQYLLFRTKIVIGTQKMPLDGNPWKHIGMLGHPNKLITMCYRQDNSFLFTIGAKDCCTCQWAANFRAVERTTILGGIDLDPYYCLVENGRPGWLFQEVRDLFYYIQILCQGTFSPAMRKVKDFIPIGSLPDLMRALGFFPSEYEVENMQVEAKYKVYNKEPALELDFEDFVKLYLNHRPAFVEGPKKIRAAFRQFSQFSKHDGEYMYREDFVDLLAEYGEKFPKELSWYLLSILMGQSFEDRAAAVEGDFGFLPARIKLSELLITILGIPESEASSEGQSLLGRGGSFSRVSIDNLAKFEDSSTEEEEEVDFDLYKLFS